MSTVFGSNALELRRHGLAVLPLAYDRKPRVSGFAKWSRLPAERTVAQWAQLHPTDNIGIIPGLSNVFVVDCDDASQDDRVRELFGWTPLAVLSNRGRHRYYRKPCERLPGNLRKFGLNVDLKGGNSIVIAPPSIHESGKIYCLDSCDWSVLKHLPLPNVEKVRGFIERQGKKSPSVEQRDMRDGSRKQWLNDMLCSHAMSCDHFGELLDVARTTNERLLERGLPMLDDTVVTKRAQQVWKDAQAGKLEHWIGREGVARSRGSEIDALCRLNPRIGPDALVLLMRFRIDHSARCRRGETFKITPKSMARHGVIHGWTRERYERARDLLLLARLIERVSAFRYTRDGREGAQYRLTASSDAGVVPVACALGGGGG